MSYYDYKIGQTIDAQCYPFYAMVQALYRKADTDNARRIEAMWPEVVTELKLRYDAPGGILPSEQEMYGQRTETEK